MKFIISTVLIMVLAFGAEYFTHIWWMIGMVAFLVSVVMKLRPGVGFLSGFLAIVVMWGCVALRVDGLNDHILSTRLAKLFPVGHYYGFIGLVVFIGGLVGGLAAWSGALVGSNGTKQDA